MVTFTGRKAIALMMTLYTLMGERRRAKIEEVIAEWKARPGIRGKDKQPRKKKE
jgi:hypothetical protein